MKVLVVILMAMVLTQFVWYMELDRRLTMNDMVDRAVMQAQNEVLMIHARTINDQNQRLIELIKESK